MKFKLFSLLIFILFSTLIGFSQKIVSANKKNIDHLKAPMDALIANWKSSWNNHDSAGVSNLFTSYALLVDDNVIAKNSIEISAKWIHPNINAVNNFKTIQLQNWSNEERAGYTGSYEFEVLNKNNLKDKIKGIFTVNWIKTINNDWKITTATIFSFSMK